MENLKRYRIVAKADGGYLREYSDGDLVKFSDIKDILNSSDNTTKATICPWCNGDGQRQATRTNGMKNCVVCNGTGKL